MLALVVGRAMPDKSGRLTKDDRAILEAWWNVHWNGVVSCPVCKTTQWNTLAHVMSIERHAGDAGVPGSLNYPMIGVQCKVCAHIMFFNAVTIGIAERYDPAQDPTVTAALPPPDKAGDHGG